MFDEKEDSFLVALGLHFLEREKEETTDVAMVLTSLLQNSFITLEDLRSSGVTEKELREDGVPLFFSNWISKNLLLTLILILGLVNTR